MIEDEIHAEQSGEFETFELALDEIRKRAHIPWDKHPNVAPCTSWRTCGRSYLIREYDNSVIPWTLVDETYIVEVDAKGVRWEPEFAPT